MNAMLDFIFMGFAELYGTGRERKVKIYNGIYKVKSTRENTCVNLIIVRCVLELSDKICISFSSVDIILSNP